MMQSVDGVDVILFFLITLRTNCMTPSLFLADEAVISRSLSLHPYEKQYLRPVSQVSFSTSSSFFIVLSKYSSKNAIPTEAINPTTKQLLHLTLDVV